jgi:glycosyltransferase involved in cell wall biosynthesis
MIRSPKVANITCVIPAFKESKFLEECVVSLVNQKDPCSIIICTSTPNSLISDIASRYELPLAINEHPKGIGADWNFSLQQVDSGLVAICHQDDTYHPEYCRSMREIFESEPDLLFTFCDHNESNEQGQRAKGLNLSIKKWLVNRAFKEKTTARTADVRRKLLSWGNPISCPSVMLNLSKLPEFAFDISWEVNLDWEAWDRICRCNGKIGFVNRELVSHRVHPGSETSASIKDNRRYREDLLMFEKFWPKWVSKLLIIPYKISYISNFE